jgi:hypothetical protein
MTNPQLSHANCQTSVRRPRVIENPIWSLMNIFYNKPPYRIFLGPQMIVSTEHRTTEHRTQVLQHPTVYGAALFAHPEYDRMDCTYQTMSRWNGTIRISTDGSAVSWPLHIAKRITEFPPNPFAHSSGSSRFAHYGYSCLTELPPRHAGRAPEVGVLYETGAADCAYSSHVRTPAMWLLHSIVRQSLYKLFARFTGRLQLSMPGSVRRGGPANEDRRRQGGPHRHRFTGKIRRVLLPRRRAMPSASHWFTSHATADAGATDTSIGSY